MFFHTQMGSIRPWLDNLRYILDSKNCGRPSFSSVHIVIMLSYELNLRMTCKMWYSFTSRSTNGSISILSFLFKIQIISAIIPFLGFFLIRYIKLTSHAITSSFVISCSNSLSVLFLDSAVFSLEEISTDTFVELLNIYFCFDGLG